MADAADLLVDDAPDRTRRVVVVGVVLLLAVAAGATAVRSTLPPEPLDVAVASVSGTALQGDSFVRVHLHLRARGAQGLGEAAFTVAGTTQRGQHPPAFDDQGRMVLQVDVTPACSAVGADVGAGLLDLQVRDETGDTRHLQLDVPSSGQLERLVRYRCRPSAGTAGAAAG